MAQVPVVSRSQMDNVEPRGLRARESSKSVFARKMRSGTFSLFEARPRSHSLSAASASPPRRNALARTRCSMEASTQPGKLPNSMDDTFYFNVRRLKSLKAA